MVCTWKHIPGRYEWVTVGRDAASVDSAGASLVTAAFKNKQVEIGLAGEDMYDSTIAQSDAMGNERDRQCYGDASHVHELLLQQLWHRIHEDYRVALRDDWCTTWPITSSNMIEVGGPIAQHAEATMRTISVRLSSSGHNAVSILKLSRWMNHIVAVTCWNAHNATHVYSSNNTIGYGVITTYLDMNGTADLQIWGNWGRDTYYVTKWFHEVGIYQLQDAPAGLTSIIVKINYKSYPEGYKPTGFSIVECLGTISERLWMHNGETKGGIHDP